MSGAEHGFEAAGDVEVSEETTGETDRLVAAQGHALAGALQALEDFLRAVEQAGHLLHHRRVVQAVERLVARRVADADGMRQQMAGTVADVPAHLGHRQRYQPVGCPDMIDAGGDRVVTVGQGAVEVEEHRTNGRYLFQHRGPGIRGCVRRSTGGVRSSLSWTPVGPSSRGQAVIRGRRRRFPERGPLPTEVFRRPFLDGRC
jgi:hypothetical protein